MKTEFRVMSWKKDGKAVGKIMITGDKKQGVDVLIELDNSTDDYFIEQKHVEWFAANLLKIIGKKII